jgi:phospholipid transport system substrate-binding protein|tara:strand:- start:55 stop:654 length:600 start_codon:yes stop_codon:yes gene_type:complete
MKKFLLSILAVVFISNSAGSVTYNSNPEIFIGELVVDAIKILSDKSIPKERKNKLVEKIILENVDIKVLGFYTLGKKRKMLSPEDLEKYNTLFKAYLLKNLISRFSDYTSQKFEVIGSEQKSATTTIVNSKISESVSQPEIKVDWRIYTKDPTKPLIRDLIVEGLSMAKIQKEEFASILNSNNNDINALFTKLSNFILN